jgi:hypothetical protein
MTNGGWRKFQATLAQLGHSRSKNSAVLLAMPVKANLDPAIQTSLSWTGCFDGTSYYVSPCLPQDFILPLRIWERQNGLQAPFGGPRDAMHCALDGLQSRTVGPFNYEWEWRGDTLYFLGSLLVVDFKIEYASFLADFVTQGSGAGQVLWYNQPVPVMRCLSPLANYIAYEFAKPRGDIDAASFQADAEEETKQLFNLEVRSKVRTTTSRRGFSSGSRRGYF